MGVKGFQNRGNFDDKLQLDSCVSVGDGGRRGSGRGEGGRPGFRMASHEQLRNLNSILKNVKQQG